MQKGLRSLPAAGGEIVASVTELGLDENSGLTGSLRQAVHGIEDVLNQQIDSSWLIDQVKSTLTEKLKTYDDGFNAFTAGSLAVLDKVAALTASEQSACNTLNARRGSYQADATQHNAALVEETNAAIGQTESRASELDRIVEVFTLDDNAAATPAWPGKPARACPFRGNAGLDKDWSEF